MQNGKRFPICQIVCEFAQNATVTFLMAQRAMTAAKLANIKHGNILGQKSDVSADTSLLVPLVSRERAAEIMNVGEASVGRAKRILAQATPEIIEQVESGNLAVITALSMIQKPKVLVNQLINQNREHLHILRNGW